MTARILVVDDIETNVKLLEARLMAEYFQVLTANNGHDALEICESGQCDLVLLDVMMPEMDGYEVCRRLKANPKTMHLPVVMVTALEDTHDRVKGLEAGADDFLSKPVNDLALITRVKSLVRLKMLTDDLRLRASNGDEMGVDQFRSVEDLNNLAERGQVAIVDDNPDSYNKMVEALSGECDVDVITDPNEALIRITEGTYEVAIISLVLEDTDSLRLCSHLRSLERTRALPLLTVAGANQDFEVSRALEIGVNDYIRTPVETSELVARIRTQLRRKRYNDCLRDSVQQTIEMAVKDPLTGLNNRRYMDAHLKGIFDKAVTANKPLSVVMCDIDHFKAVNDTHGHDVGDEVIKEVANRIAKSIRNIDCVCRFGGEEFVIIMPDTALALAEVVSERIRQEIEKHPVVAASGSNIVPITMSMGVANLVDVSDSPQTLLKRADLALYEAKQNGRNQVVTQAA